MGDQPMITTSEERDALPPGAVVVWTLADHPGHFDGIAAKYRAYLSDEVTLERGRAGWRDESEPLFDRTGDDLPPLPWRLVSKPGGAE